MALPSYYATEATPFAPKSSRSPVWQLWPGVAAVVLLFTVLWHRNAGAEAAVSLDIWRSLQTTFGGITVETPKYEVVDRIGDVEIRQYNSGVAIETDASNANNAESFRRLARYIGAFGNPANRKTQPIAMTAPVVTQGETIAMTAPVLTASKGKKGSMRFILPSQYQSVRDAPKPTDPQVKVVKLPSRLVAVQTFNGETNEVDTARRAQAIAAAVERRGYRVAAAAQLARYNDRRCWPLFRRNEVQLPVETGK
eukprot:EG_transcript_19414